RNRCEAARRAFVGCAKDYDQEEERHHDFTDQSRHQRETSKRVLGITIRGESLVDVESGLTTGNQVENSRPDNSAYYLRHDIRQHVFRWNPATGTESNRHCGIEVAAGDVT